LIIHSISAYTYTSSCSSTTSTVDVPTQAPEKLNGEAGTAGGDTIPYALAKDKSLNDRGEAPPAYDAAPGYKLRDEKDALMREKNAKDDGHQWLEWIWGLAARANEACLRCVRFR
jgi:hypothetical protein